MLHYPMPHQFLLCFHLQLSLSLPQMSDKNLERFRKFVLKQQSLPKSLPTLRLKSSFSFLHLLQLKLGPAEAWVMLHKVIARIFVKDLNASIANLKPLAAFAALAVCEFPFVCAVSMRGASHY